MFRRFSTSLQQAEDAAPVAAEQTSPVEKNEINDFETNILDKYSSSISSTFIILRCFAVVIVTGDEQQADFVAIHLLPRLADRTGKDQLREDLRLAQSHRRSEED